MDPFGDLFSFINTNDLKKKKEVHNIHKKTVCYGLPECLNTPDLL